MNENQEIVLQDQPDQPPALALIQQAIATGVAPESLRELLAVKKDWEADEARKAYARSVCDFQARCPIIEKADKAYDKEYARIDRIWRTIRPLLTELGLSVTWQVCELRDGFCRVEGTLMHRDGHGSKITQDVPMPELIKGQNKAQQGGSASTYAKRYALCGALGIVLGDDDDGFAAGVQFVTPEQSGEIRELIETCKGLPGGFNESAFWKFVAPATCPEQIAAHRFGDIRASLQRKIKGAA